MNELLIIDNNIVRGCTRQDIMNAEIPSGIEAIDDKAFEGQSKLTSVAIPPSVSYIGEGTFKDCSSLEKVDLSGVSGLGQEAFAGCTSLRKVTLGEKLTFLCNATFMGCKSLTEMEVPEKIVYIGCECFRDCSSLSEITLNGVMEIDNNAFEGCTELYSISFPASLIHIAPQAFSFCRNLGTATFFNRFIDIDETAFENTTKKVFKAVQYSTVYDYAINNSNIIFRPTILKKDALEIDAEKVDALKKAGIMFMVKPNPPDKAFILFDSSQRELIIKTLGGICDEKQE